MTYLSLLDNFKDMRACLMIIAWILILDCVSGQQRIETSPNDLFEMKVGWQQKNEPDDFKSILAKFVSTFNTGEFNNIEAIVSSKLFENTDREKFLSFLKFYNKTFGVIEEYRFKYFDSRNQRGDKIELAVYWTKFGDTSTWEIRVGLDEDGLISKFIITDNNKNEDLPLKNSTVELVWPFVQNESWYVLWGGESKEENYHVVSKSQKNALDLIIKHPWSKKSYASGGSINKDYYAFDKPVYSPASGTVVKVVNNVDDNIPGEMNRKNLTGNTVVIEINQYEFLLLAHLKQGSIDVEESQIIDNGTYIGRVGNSGNSSEPHLHIQLMDNAEMIKATGIKMYFDQLTLNYNSPVSHYSPVRGNIISGN